MLNTSNLPLEKKKIVKKTIERSPLAFLLLIVFGGFLVGLNFIIPEYNLWWTPIAAFGIFVLGMVFVYIYQTYYYKLYFYEFREDGAEIKKGVISQSAGHVRYERIQNIYIDQDVLDRIFGLFDVHYETAGETSGIYSHVDGLNQANSKKLVDFLNGRLDRVNAKVEPAGTIASKIEAAPVKTQINGETIDRVSVPISKKIIVENVIAQLFYSIFIILFIIGGSVEDVSDLGALNISLALIWLVVLVFVFLGILIYNKVWYKNFYFQFSDKSGVIRTQVIGLATTYVYYDRIQNINVKQNVIDKMFGLFSVSIETAAEGNKKREKNGLQIPGLSKDNAEKIKNFLLAKSDLFKNKL